MKNQTGFVFLNSPLGIIKITGDYYYVSGIDFVDENMDDLPENSNSPALKKCSGQLEEYFAGKRKTFDVPLKLEGTTFQKKIWEALGKIPYGKTCSYQDIAIMTGNPRAVRAVGGANNKNPVGIIVPCHRVIGKDGSLTGYGGGLWRKEWLLEHEKKISSGFSSPS